MRYSLICGHNPVRLEDFFDEVVPANLTLPATPMTDEQMQSFVDRFFTEMGDAQ